LGLRSKSKKLIGDIVYYTVALIIVSLVILPLYFMFMQAFTPETQIYHRNLIPESFTLSNFVELFRQISKAGSVAGTSFFLYVRNSLFISSLTTIINLCVSTLAAYSLARLRYRGKYLCSTIVLFTYLFPAVVLMVPIYIILASFSLTNTLEGVVIALSATSLPFTTWLLNGYFRTLPLDIEESALIDGCSQLGILVRIVLPISLPGLVVAAIFSFTQAWNNFLFAYILIDRPPLLPLSVASMRLIKFEYVEWSKLMAAGIVAAIVPVILYMSIQRYVVKGLTAGAVKG